VQIPLRAIDGERRRHQPARAEIHRRAAAGVARTIDEDQRVAANPIRVFTHRRGEIRRSGFLFAFEDDADVRGDRGRPLRIERIDRREQRDDRRLVVRGGASVDAPLGIDGALPRLERDRPAGRRVRHHNHRRERRLVRPLGRHDRLAVVMKIERERARRRRCAALHQHERRAGGRHHATSEVTMLEHRHQRVGVAADIGGVGGDVRDREQVEELVKNLRLVLRAPGVHARERIVCGGGEEHQRDGRRQRSTDRTAPDIVFAHGH
jgi:hypothetical protein